ncbi:MAG: glycosyltransferase [Leptolyngbyaceae cyanobacterium bins.59]|nr:glycosyltransferase [Leptolyngbyaceae cyanobacterium bins.59]
MPKVSVCIPTYNRVQLLPYAIESVLHQTLTDLEVIVCDDGSTDGTAERMAQVQDDRVRYIRHPQNIGKSNNMRSGFDAATGEYFIKFDDDDRLTPEFLAHTVAILDSDPTLDFVSTDHWIINLDNLRDETQTRENSEKWGRTDLPQGPIANLLELAFVQQPMQIGATLFRRSTLQEMGFLLPNLQNCEDNDLFVRLALAEKRGYYLPELLMEYRVHPEQRGLNRDIRYLGDKVQYLERYQFESPHLEAIRRGRLQDTQFRLGMRLIEKGEDDKGRELLWAHRSFSPKSAWVGLALSFVPKPFRSQAFAIVRQAKKD